MELILSLNSSISNSKGRMAYASIPGIRGLSIVGTQKGSEHSVLKKTKVRFISLIRSMRQTLTFGSIYSCKSYPCINKINSMLVMQ